MGGFGRIRLLRRLGRILPEVVGHAPAELLGGFSGLPESVPDFLVLEPSAERLRGFRSRIAELLCTALQFGVIENLADGLPEGSNHLSEGVARLLSASLVLRPFVH